MTNQRAASQAIPEDVQRYEQQAAWRDFSTPLDLLEIRAGWRILDVGCGSGVATRLLAGRGKPGFIVGVDAVVEHAIVARALTPNVAAGIGAFLAGDARRLPFADGTFDLLWSSFVLEYLGSTAVATLREFARVVRPGGTVAVFDVDGFLLHHDPIDPDLAERIEGWRASALARGFDPEIGHKLPEYFAEVERPAKVRVAYIDRDGNKQEMEAEGVLAVCLQHEIDHIDGRLFIDRLSKLKRDMVIKKFAKQAKIGTKTAL